MFDLNSLCDVTFGKLSHSELTGGQNTAPIECIQIRTDARIMLSTL